MDIIIDFGLKVVIPALFGAGGGWALLYFFGQRLVDHRLKKDLERYRVELAEKTEAFKTQLAIYAHEQNIAAARVDEQRSLAISNIYSCIRNVINLTSPIIAGCPIIQDDTAKYVRAVGDYYFQNAQAKHNALDVLSNKTADLAIYIDHDTYLKIYAYAKVSMKATGEYLDTLQPLGAYNNMSDDEILKVGDKILKIVEMGRPTLKKLFEEEMKPKAQELAEIFRDQLGMERKNK